MVVKDRLKELHAQSKHADGRCFENIEKSTPKQDEGISEVLQKAEALFDKIKEYKNNVNDIRESHYRILQEPSKQEREKLKAHQDQLAKTLSMTGNDIQSELKVEEESIAKMLSNKTMTPIEFMIFKVKRNLVSSLSITFQESLGGYSQMETDFKVKTKDELLKKIRISDKELNPEEIEQKILIGDMSTFSDEDNQRTEEARMMLMEIQDRHEDILKLEAKVMTLHCLVNDTMNLVRSQGEILEKIEIRYELNRHNLFSNMDVCIYLCAFLNFSAEIASMKVEQGADQLNKAKDYQTSSRKKKICLVGGAVIVVLIVILVGIFDPTKSIMQ